MNTKDNQRSRLTRLLLKNAYMQLMAENPAAKISVKSICALAEVNRSTFYLYYNEPNDLLMELEDETIALVRESIYTIGAQDHAPADAQLYLLTFLQNVRRNDRLFRTLLVDNSDPHFRRKLQAVALEMARSAFSVYLAEELQSSIYLYLVSGSIEVLVDWIRSGYTIPDKTLCQLLFQLCEGSLKSLVL